MDKKIMVNMGEMFKGLKLHPKGFKQPKKGTVKIGGSFKEPKKKEVIEFDLEIKFNIEY